MKIKDLLKVFKKYICRPLENFSKWFITISMFVVIVLFAWFRYDEIYELISNKKNPLTSFTAVGASVSKKEAKDRESLDKNLLENNTLDGGANIFIYPNESTNLNNFPVLE